MIKIWRMFQKIAHAFRKIETRERHFWMKMHNAVEVEYRPAQQKDFHGAKFHFSEAVK